MANNIKEYTVGQKHQEIEKIMKLLEKYDRDFQKLGDNLEKLEELETTIKRILGSFSELGIKEIVKNIQEKITSEMSDFKKTKEDVEELIDGFEKQAEVDTVVNALDIAIKDSEDSKLKQNLENMISYIKENGTGNDSITLLSRASWEW